MYILRILVCRCVVLVVFCCIIVVVCDGYVCLCVFVVFFFKQKTAYEMRISDWSSDVCSSDLEVGSPMFLVKNQADRPALAKQRTDLAPAQSRVERDDDQARLGRSKLKQGPWSAIRAPDGNILSGTEMLGEEGC